MWLGHTVLNAPHDDNALFECFNFSIRDDILLQHENIST